MPIDCMDICKLDHVKLDALVAKFDDGESDKEEILTEIISLFRCVINKEPTNRHPFIENIKNYINEQRICLILSTVFYMRQP